MGFIDEIKARAKADKKTIVLPETEDERTYKAAETVLKEGIADLILVGSKEQIEKTKDHMTFPVLLLLIRRQVTRQRAILQNLLS